MTQKHLFLGYNDDQVEPQYVVHDASLKSAVGCLPAGGHPLAPHRLPRTLAPDRNPAATENTAPNISGVSRPVCVL